MTLSTFETHAALFDYLQMRFGIGDGPEQHEGKPWFRIRGTEIAKLKSTMRRRRLELEDMALCVWYAETQGIPIKAVWQLCELSIDARRAWRQEQRAGNTEAMRQQLNDYASLAYGEGHYSWADQFIACSLDEGPRVVEGYQKFLEAQR